LLYIRRVRISEDDNSWENGSKIKIVGINSRMNIEKIYDKKVFLDLTVKVMKWRNNDRFLKNKY
jgi:GTPase Era involved in 16S rRNA processing